MVRTVTGPRAFMLNKPFCGSLHARWLVTNTSDQERVAELQAVALPSHEVLATGDKTSIPPGDSRELTLDWGMLADAGDFTLRVADEEGLTILDKTGKNAERPFRLFLVT